MAAHRNFMRSGYFALQGAATLAWWTLLAVSPSARRWFAFGDAGDSLLPFLPADIVFWCAGSWAAAQSEWSGARWAPAVRLLLCGGLACSVLHAASLAMLAGAGWPGVVLMLPALAVTWCLTWTAPSAAA
jgi:hypothetical protein